MPQDIVIQILPRSGDPLLGFFRSRRGGSRGEELPWREALIGELFIHRRLIFVGRQIHIGLGF